ncbi:hypothetical protein CEXT_481701, partial [Caerostris extrusa]
MADTERSESTGLPTPEPHFIPG